MIRCGVSAIVLSFLACPSVLAEDDGKTCDLTLKLVSESTGATFPGLVNISTSAGERVDVEELLNRGMGLRSNLPIARWFVLPGARTVKVPRARLVVEGFQGLSTSIARVEIDLREKEKAQVELKPRHFYPRGQIGYYSANTHLHLNNISRQESDRYLREIPAADGLDYLFVSYLERAGDDKGYISNEYRREDMAAFSAASGVDFGWGEEHRHNFGSYGEGYGHVMFLDLRELVQPVSVGPGITKKGFDGLPIRRGIEAARKQNATVIWCHNTFGVEGIPNLLDGRCDALNIFDGGEHGSYADSYYRYLELGLDVPFSTGTDWFQYDFSRVFARLDGKPTRKKWLEALSEGRTFITNGPILMLDVDDSGPGEFVKLDTPGKVRFSAAVGGRVDFRRIELLVNGKVHKTKETEPENDAFVARLRGLLDIDEPSWIALRIPPAKREKNTDGSDGAVMNELGRPLFGHTSAIHVEVAGKRRFNSDVADSILAELEESIATIREKGVFETEAERDEIIAVYTSTMNNLRTRKSNAKK